MKTRIQWQIFTRTKRKGHLGGEQDERQPPLCVFHEAELLPVSGHRRLRFQLSCAVPETCRGRPPTFLPKRASPHGVPPGNNRGRSKVFRQPPRTLSAVAQPANSCKTLPFAVGPHSQAACRTHLGPMRSDRV